jgi:hypothetical protein
MWSRSIALCRPKPEIVRIEDRYLLVLPAKHAISRRKAAPDTHVRAERHRGGPDVTRPEDTGIELLLSEPEIVAWLEPTEPEDDDDPSRAS